MVPPLTVAEALFHEAVHILDRIVLIGTPIPLFEYAEPIQREGVFNSFPQRTNRRPVALVKFGTELLQGRPGLLIGLLLVDASQLPTPLPRIQSMQENAGLLPTAATAPTGVLQKSSTEGERRTHFASLQYIKYCIQYEIPLAGSGFDSSPSGFQRTRCAGRCVSPRTRTACVSTLDRI